jgi:hypothetical protein
MTNETINAAIDNMVAAGGSFENTRVATPQPNLKYDGATGEITQDGPSVDAPIPDDSGAVPSVMIAQIKENMAKLVAECNAETNPAKREVLLAQLGRAHESALYDIARLSALTVQRENQALAAEAQANQKLAEAAFSDGDPVRAAALKSALLDEEAKLAARTIIATRHAEYTKGRK